MIDPIPMTQEIIANPAIQEATVKSLATVFAKGVGETGIKLLGKGGSSLINTGGQLTEAARNLLFPVFRKYVINYNNRHGLLKVLRMRQSVSLDSVYTQVNFRPETILYYQSIDDEEEVFRQRELQDKEKRLGLDMARENQYLMVLGGPGTGKSTFLRKLGLEALKGDKGQYKIDCIPVLLELRKFNQKAEVNLVEKIAEEFKNCGLPEYESCVQQLLEKGKLLILLDGLDEVPTERLPQITTSIRNLLDCYDKNRFITSCRIAAYRNFDDFQRFTDVVVADFDDQQVEAFITKWFESHSQPEWGKQCWEKLNGGEHQATKELTRTPLLLTLICILFRQRGEFPNKRATVYNDALCALLSEWDASKELVRSSPYEGMDTKCKEILLAEIAYNNFVEDNLFFQELEITQEIEDILKEMLEERLINGRDVLRAIEGQHGVLVSRGDSIYSFSHLTLQEFLTAKHILDNDIDIKQLVNKHLCDTRWREVFLILAGLKRADSLLHTMADAINSLMDSPKLNDLLVWVQRISNPTSGEIKPVGKRAISLAFANVNAYAKANANANANTYAYSLPNAYTNACDYACALAKAYTNAYPYTYVYVYAKANVITKVIFHGNSIIITVSDDNTKVLDEMINHAKWAEDNQIYQEINPTKIMTQLKQLKTEITNDTQPEKDFKAFTEKIIRVWLQGFHLTPEMLNFSQSEIKTLENYLYANKLMMDCKEAAVRVNPKVWEEIETKMLLPNQ
ncbi:MAG: NACHT domain-containing NTPase [Crocosphaera sp.]